jgi:hypothetical protein
LKTENYNENFASAMINLKNIGVEKNHNLVSWVKDIAFTRKIS